jgi:hypothetical protein
LGHEDLLWWVRYVISWDNFVEWGGDWEREVVVGFSSVVCLGIGAFLTGVYILLFERFFILFLAKEYPNFFNTGSIIGY